MHGLLLLAVAAAGCSESAAAPRRGDVASVQQLNRVALSEADRAARALDRCRRRVRAGPLRLHHCTFRALARAEASAAVNARLLQSVGADGPLPPACSSVVGAIAGGSMALAAAARDARLRTGGAGWTAVRRATGEVLRLARDVRAAARRAAGGGCRGPPAYPRHRMQRQIALLRGINVGGHRQVSMSALRELLTGLGYGDVRTLLQSGNVVLTSDAQPDRLARDLERQIAEGLGVDPAVIVRTRDEVAAAIEHNPLGDVADNPKLHLVYFLSAVPDPAAIAALEAADIAPERVAAHGRELYTWHPNGIQRSPLAKLVSDRRLGVAATGRNWNTVTKLLALADAE